jgi:hypothetical protein
MRMRLRPLNVTHTFRCNLLHVYPISSKGRAKALLKDEAATKSDVRHLDEKVIVCVCVCVCV